MALTIFLFLFQIPYPSEVMNRFVKMQRQISVGPAEQVKVAHLQRWARIFRSERTETDLSFWLLTEISEIFGIIESTQVLRKRVDSFRDNRNKL